MSDRGRRLPRFVAAAIITAAAAVVALPDLLGLDATIPFAQIVAFRPWILLGLLGLVVLFGLLTWRWHKAWPFAAGTCAVLLAGAVLVVPRAVPGPAPAPGTSLTVMVANVYVGQADPAALAALIAQARPDVVSLPESADRFRDRIEPLVAPLGYTAHVSVPDGTDDVDGVTALVASRLGDVHTRIGTDTALDPYLELTGGALGPLHVVAYHAAAPTDERIDLWRHDMALLARWCSGSTPTVIAGDFNATLDHSLLRSGTAGCTDAASARGDGLAPTWSPSTRTVLFGPQIDHVFATRGITASAFAVHGLPGSDHRAITATLRTGP